MQVTPVIIPLVLPRIDRCFYSLRSELRRWIRASIRLGRWWKAVGLFRIKVDDCSAHLEGDQAYIYAVRLDGILLSLSSLQIGTSTIVHSSVFPIWAIYSLLFFLLIRSSTCGNLLEGKLGFHCVTIGFTNIPLVIHLVVRGLRSCGTAGMRSAILLVLTMAVMALSLPTLWSPDTAKFYAGVSKEIANRHRGGHRGGYHNERPACDLSEVVLPQSSEPLPEIPDGQKLLAVTIGRGTQNYTCEAPEESIQPVARGALATLFNASCIAANYPYLLYLLPNIALQLSNPDPTVESFGPSGMGVAGVHYFSDATTALFNVTGLGESYVKKENAVDAPSGSVGGIEGQLTGAAAWLFLASTPESPGRAKSIYRVNTAGGSPPKNCSGQPAEINVEYATEYWLYG